MNIGSKKQNKTGWQEVRCCSSEIYCIMQYGVAVAVRYTCTVQCNMAVQSTVNYVQSRSALFRLFLSCYMYFELLLYIYAYTTEPPSWQEINLEKMPSTGGSSVCTAQCTVLQCIVQCVLHVPQLCPPLVPVFNRFNATQLLTGII